MWYAERKGEFWIEAATVERPFLRDADRRPEVARLRHAGGRAMMNGFDLSTERADVHDGPDGLEVIIPAPRNWFVIAFLLFWLGGWTTGGLGAVWLGLSSDVPGPVKLFLLFWLGGWLLGEVYAIYTVAWQLAGRERIVLAPSHLLLAREVFGLGRRRTFDLQRVSNLRVVPRMPPGPAGAWAGRLAFDYGSSTVRWGRGLDEPEAERIAGLLRGRHDFGGAADHPRVS
ncbi:MAG: hypothetical protein D6760_05450 [Deltaproteobacteria bacterium]|nr:MAG: hypothetical protein D6760_05450 [Deltaproteobacteria bacterium]